MRDRRESAEAELTPEELSHTDCWVLVDFEKRAVITLEVCLLDEKERKRVLGLLEADLFIG